MDGSKNGDAAAVAFLKWILAALLLLNGGALAITVVGHKGRGAFLDGAGWNDAAGLLCALVGALCWAISYGSSRSDTNQGRSPASGAAGQLGSNDHAIAFGGLAIILWVASLTSFVIGCERLSGAPGGDPGKSVSVHRHAE